MRFNHSVVLLFAALLMPWFTHAQVAFGVRGGAAWSNMVFPDVDDDGIGDINWETKSSVTPQVALFADVPFSQRFSLVPEVGFQQRGYFYDKSDFPGSIFVEQRLMLDYFEFNALGKFHLGREPARLHLLLGPGIGRMVGARNIIENYDPWIIGSNGSVLAPDDLKMPRLNVGIIGGVGATFSVRSSWIGIEARYQYGLTNIWNGIVLTDFNGATIGELNSFDRSASIHATWMFPLGEAEAVSGSGSDPTP